MNINISETPYLRTIRSFVKREGRLTKSQSQAIERLWPAYGLSIDEGCIDFQKTFQRQANTILEIGFGMGDSLAAVAEKQPENNFIGIEVHRPGIGHILKLIDEKQLTNIRLYDQDAIDVLKQAIPDHNLDKIQIFFPDPWPKKRHHKRRLIQPDFMQLIQQKLKDQGMFHAATDWENYAEHILAVMAEQKAFIQITDEEIIKKEKSLREITKFEKRGERLSHDIYDYIWHVNV